MNSKTIFKRILPIVIALLLVVIIAVVTTVASSGKKNPVLSGAEEGYIVYTTQNGEEIKVSKEKVWNTLKGSVTAATTTVSEIVDQIDRAVLKKYVDAVKPEEVSDKIAEYLFGSSYNDYIEKNKAAWELAAKKKGSNDWEAEAIKAIKEVLEAKEKDLKFSYGISAELVTDTNKDGKLDVTYLANGVLDGEEGAYKFAVDTTCAFYDYYKVPVARSNYALEKLTEEYKEQVSKYNQYLKDKEDYEEYLKDLEDYEEDYEDWKNEVKEWRENGKQGPQPSEPSEPQEVEAPKEEVAAPILVESDFQKIYEEEFQNKYWAILIPYESNQAAVDALYQAGIVIAKNFEGDYVWFKAAKLDTNTPVDTINYIKENDYTVRGDAEDYTAGIITDNAFYQLIMTQEQFDKQSKKLTTYIVNDSATGQNNAYALGAKQLSGEEVKAEIVKLYNQFYQANAEKQITDAYATDETQLEKLEYTQSELSSLSLYSTATTNKFNKYEAGKTDDDFGIYDYKDVSNRVVTAGSKYYLYYILNKETVTDWKTLVEEAGKDYTKTDFFKQYIDLTVEDFEKQETTEKLAELLEGKLTTTYTNEKVAAARFENALKIYDADLEEIYMTTYTSDYKAVKKSSKNVVASVEVEGTKVEVELDKLFDTLVTKYGILTALESYQYDWIFLEANYGSKEELANVYVDYVGYKKAGKNLAKYIKDTEEAQDLYKDVQTYVTNTKNNFASGSYESQGYPADYGWENFMRDYFLESYGVEINSTDDLALFYIYQQIVDDYSKHIAKLTKDPETGVDPWTEIMEVYMAQQLSTYLNTTGVHFLISVNDEEGNPMDPKLWAYKEDGITLNDLGNAAVKLHEEVMSIIAFLPKDKVSSVMNEIVTAYNAAPLLMLDGTTPNDKYSVIWKNTIDDTEVTYFETVLDYNYTYYLPNNIALTVDLSTPKSLGLSVTTESLTVTEGAMVTPFENAVRELWNANLDVLLSGESIDAKDIYDSRKEIIGYEKEEVRGLIETEFGYHLYVNLTMSMKDYTTTKDEETVFVTFPSYNHALMYVYEANENAEEEYVSFADLLEDLEDAEEDKDDAKKAEAIEAIKELFDELGVSYANEDDMRAILEAYAGEGASYTKSQLNTWFTTYSASNGTTTFTNVYSDLTGSTYYQLKVLNAILAGQDKFSAGDKKALEESLSYYVDTYYDSLTHAYGLLEYANTKKMDKEDVEELLATLHALTLGVDVTEDVKAVAGAGFDKLVEIAEKVAKDYTAEDFENENAKAWYK